MLYVCIYIYIYIYIHSHTYIYIYIYIYIYARQPPQVQAKQYRAPHAPTPKEMEDASAFFAACLGAS